MKKLLFISLIALSIVFFMFTAGGFETENYSPINPNTEQNKSTFGVLDEEDLSKIEELIEEQSSENEEVNTTENKVEYESEENEVNNKNITEEKSLGLKVVGTVISMGYKNNSPTLLIQNEESGSYIFSVSEKTKIDNIENIKVNSLIEVTFYGVLTKTIPPQGTAAEIKLIKE